MRFGRGLLAAFLGAALVAGLHAAYAAEPVKIRIGWVVLPPELQPILFAKTGIAKHLGKSYTYEPVHFGGTPAMITALAAGELDIASFTFATVGSAIENAGLGDLRIIADEFQDGAHGYYSERYLVRKDSGIRTVEDLKGKVMATNSIGSGVDMAMRVMLRKHHLEDKRDYSVIEVQFPNMKAMLLEKKVDLINEPTAFAYDPEILQNTRTLFTMADAIGPSQFTIWTARAGFLEKHHAAVVDFLEDTLRALHWYLDPKNHEEAVEILAKFTKRPAASFESWAFTKQDNYRDPEGLPDLDALQRAVDMQRELGFLKAPLDVRKYADLSLVKEAAKRIK